MMLALATCPALLGTAEAIRQSQSKERREEHRARRCNLVVTCVESCSRSRELDNRQVVPKDNKVGMRTLSFFYPFCKPPTCPYVQYTIFIWRLSNRHQLYIDTGSREEEDDKEDSTNEQHQFGHPFAGYYLPYPDTKYEGLVSTTTENPPILNWIYVDKDTYEVKHGVRAQAQPNITGPFDCTRQDRRLTLEGWEGFVAVEEEDGLWALYFDRDDDGLKGKVRRGTRVLEVGLMRREKRVKKPVGTSIVDVQKIPTGVVKSHLSNGGNGMDEGIKSLSDTNTASKGNLLNQSLQSETNKKGGSIT